MKKWIKEIVREKQGMTIIEVLVVMALIGIITLPILQMMYTGQTLFTDHQDALGEKSSFILVEEKVREEIRLAKTIKVVNKETLGPLEEKQMALYIKTEDETSQLVRKMSNGEEQVLLEKGLLSNNQLKLVFKLIKEKKQVVQIELTGAFYHIETAFNLQNLKQSEVENWEESQGEVLIYTK